MHKADSNTYSKLLHSPESLGVSIGSVMERLKGKTSHSDGTGIAKPRAGTTKHDVDLATRTLSHIVDMI